MSVVASMIGYIGSHRHDRGAIFLYFVLELWGLSTVTTYLISVRSLLVVPALVHGPSWSPHSHFGARFVLTVRE